MVSGLICQYIGIWKVDVLSSLFYARDVDIIRKIPLCNYKVTKEYSKAKTGIKGYDSIELSHGC